jgi:hypothetical protein
MAFPLSDAEHAAIKARIDGQEELIVAAAIRWENLVVMVERPGRHGNCINPMHALGLPHRDQGFVTNRGRFVDRTEAAEIVVRSGQGTARDFGPDYPESLFSEDMWNDWDVSPRKPIDPATIFSALTGDQP